MWVSFVLSIHARILSEQRTQRLRILASNILFNGRFCCTHGTQKNSVEEHLLSTTVASLVCFLVCFEKIRGYSRKTRIPFAFAPPLAWLEFAEKEQGNLEIPIRYRIKMCVLYFCVVKGNQSVIHEHFPAEIRCFDSRRRPFSHGWPMRARKE